MAIQVIASQKYVRCSSQKLKFVADSVKQLELGAMREQLGFLNKEAARRLLQTLDQAIANASHNFGIGQDQLKLESLLILRGPQYKRMRAVSRGQGHAILKRTSHIVIKLKSIDKKAEVKKSEQIEAKSKDVKAAEPKEIKKETKKTVAKKTTKAKVKKEE
jgi:large subunit ribosomal protein L22